MCIFKYLCRRALLNDSAAVHEYDMIGHITGKRHLVGDDDHGGVLVRQRADNAQHLAGQLGVERRGRLIEAQDIRLERERTRNGDTLLLPPDSWCG